MTSIGKVTTIMRHPVKSLRGEEVAETRIMNYGLYGDRSHALMDGDRFYTATQNKELLGFHAAFDGEEQDKKYPPVKIYGPEEQTFYWHEAACLSTFEELAGKPLTQQSYTPEHVPFGAIEEEHLLIVNAASIEHLEKTLGREIDWRRFRPNLIVSLNDDVPFSEEKLIGQKISLGEAGIEIVRPCERCSIINIDPETLHTDPAVLKTVYQQYENCFGMYAKVLKAGRVRVGDDLKKN
ncbi:MOSC domain-containing protein [Jeotgalibacillus sp. R-1-5s-1]|uniref:MOSC domain-containing protein n=1 Tax=Jeotgalibacillus sp. R-1-5s-1 TaxID=2555897 RepID=UPI00106A6C41|nr:MOSC domain-containing protein [Jeotgalibacillus sp. R-1-5s-1]TFD94485.1 MOSC domain-containing protein [Jeotgalibacillus sp. R-1-5s-1]